MSTRKDEEALAFRRLEVNLSKERKRKRLMNAITTTKYTWYSWLPKSIWEQFRRIANIYFLVISVLMLLGTYATFLFVSPLDPFSTVMTLAFVLLVTSLKEGSEDLKRASSDKFENERVVKVVTFTPDGKEEITEKLSKDINPGDIIKLEGHSVVPADMVLIVTSSFLDGNKCYIETANIDGETNLKVREAPNAIVDFPSLGQDHRVTSELFDGSIEFENPNKNIHNFIGTLTLKNREAAVPLGADNILLRSAIFSNTDWAYGIAVYTGLETKIQMNNRNPPSKMSKIEEKANLAIIIIFFAQVVLVTISVICIYAMGFNKLSDLPYVNPPGADRSSVLPLWLEQWFVFFLLYNNFIPISLYVTIELVNVGQAYLIAKDPTLYKEDLDVPCGVKSSNLVQELGMVSNIFSDKTGTLTKNEMKLVKFVLNGTQYDIKQTIDAAGGDVNKAISTFGPNQKALFEFCRCLMVCHTVVKEENGNYRAESPDELALVFGAENYNCSIIQRGSKDITVSIHGIETNYQILAVNPFNSDRKRMSVLIRDTQSGTYYVMCKGADNIMIPLCSLEKNDIISIDNSLLDLANLGLRTLIIASRIIPEKEALEWLSKFNAACVSTVNREENISAVSAELELGLRCIGITAIEDNLQDEVPEVIADLAKAGIVLWMLTGDKLESAISIGKSCNLIIKGTHLLYLTKIHSTSEYRKKITEVYDELKKKLDSGVNNLALVMDGPSFTHFDFDDKDMRSKLLFIGKSCRSVIACRLTPVQKRELVRLVKKDSVPRSITLSIGDGANDVAMIMEADVGVGIYGKEGRQAANNADFAIGEFKFLRKLLLVHGRWNYIRQARVFLYSMHKNMVITLTLFWFSYYTAISGTSLYQSWVYAGYNFVLALPIIAYGIFDRDLSEKFVLAHPQTYSTSKNNSLLTIPSISLWIINACVYAVLICLTFYLCLWDSFEGHSLYTAGTIVFIGLCQSLQYKVAFFHHQWAYPHIICMAISVIGMFIYIIVVSSGSSDYYGVAEKVFADPLFWLFGFFIGPMIAACFDWFLYYLQYLICPTYEMLYRELENSYYITNIQNLTLPESKNEVFVTKKVEPSPEILI